jgi:peptide/nickel transport system permease protein
MEGYLRALFKNRISILSLIIILFVIGLAVFGPYFEKHDPLETHMAKMLRPPTAEFPFGTDALGRCVASRIIYGARTTLLAGLVAIVIGAVLGTFLGLVSGFYVGKVDNLIMRGLDVLLAFPYFLLAVVIVAALGPSLNSIMIAIGIWEMPYYARLVRGSVLSIKEKEYVEAARMVGEKDSSILMYYILPNCISPIIIMSTVYYAWAILMASTLSFLGLGVQPPAPEWGVMTAEGREYLLFAPYLLFFPALFVCLTASAFNFLGDALRDLLDPRLHMR